MFFTILVQAHFVSVLWQHYKNAHLPKSKGGCEDDMNPDIQLGGVVPTQSSVDLGTGRVAHAIDDSDLRSN